VGTGNPFGASIVAEYAGSRTVPGCTSRLAVMPRHVCVVPFVSGFVGSLQPPPARRAVSAEFCTVTTGLHWFVRIFPEWAWMSRDLSQVRDRSSGFDEPHQSPLMVALVKLMPA
jgi:hypothetical protein